MRLPPDPHRRHRFPAGPIGRAVWLHHVFGASLRDVEPIPAERGVVVSHGSVRRRCRKFGRSFADKPRRRRPRPGDEWHLDEVFIRIRGKRHHLRRAVDWRAVDQDGVVLDILVRGRRDAKAAERFFEKPLRGSRCAPRGLVTDKPKGCGAAKREVLPPVEHRRSRPLDDRAENSHRPTRRRERRMRRFESARHAQRFVPAHGPTSGHFRPRRHRMAAGDRRVARTEAFRIRREETGARRGP